MWFRCLEAYQLIQLAIVVYIGYIFISMKGKLYIIDVKMNIIEKICENIIP